MKQLGNTLYITRQGTYVSRDGTNVVISQDRKELLRLPVHTIASIVCFGNVLVTPFALGLCGDNHVAVSFLTENGHFMARSTGAQSGNILLRRAQHRFSMDDTLRAVAARAFVAAKIANTRILLLRFMRDHPDIAKNTELSRVTRYLALQLRLLQYSSRADSMDVIRGMEGDAARETFGIYNCLILGASDDFFFTQRSRRPPLDNFNAMLSFFYTILAHECTAACESVGLDPQMGFLHADRPGRPSLALDLMEEFRPWMVDRFVFRQINLGQVKGSDFIKHENGAVEIKENMRRELLKQWQDRKKESLQHPFIGEKMMIGQIPFVQAQLFARWLRGDLDAYPPFFYK